jgi:hypothetical protein
MSKENLKEREMERETIGHVSQMGSRHQDRLADWLTVGRKLTWTWRLYLCVPYGSHSKQRLFP